MSYSKCHYRLTPLSPYFLSDSHFHLTSLSLDFSFCRHKAVPTTFFSFEILVILIDQAKLYAYPNEKTEMEILPIFSILNVVHVSKEE